MSYNHPNLRAVHCLLCQQTCYSLLPSLPQPHTVLLLYPELPQRSTVCAHVELGATLLVNVEAPVI